MKSEPQRSGNLELKISFAEQPVNGNEVEKRQYPDLDGGAGGCAEPVSVRAEAESVDGVATIQSVQVLPFIQIPQHGLPVLHDDSETRTQSISANTLHERTY